MSISEIYEEGWGEGDDQEMIGEVEVLMKRLETIPSGSGRSDSGQRVGA